jgi:hypothetical protein
VPGEYRGSSGRCQSVVPLEAEAGAALGRGTDFELKGRDEVESGHGLGSDTTRNHCTRQRPRDSC